MVSKTSSVNRHLQSFFTIAFITIAIFIMAGSAFAQSQADQQKARTYYMQAEAAYEGEEWAKTLEYLDKVVELLGESNATIESLKVKALFELKQYAKAQDALNRFYKMESTLSLQKEMSGYLVKIEEKLEAILRAEIARKEKQRREQQARLEAERRREKELTRQLRLDNQLFSVIKVADIQSVDSLLELGADINVSLQTTGESSAPITPLIWVVYNGKIVLVKTLIAKGAKPWLKIDENNRYPMYYAIKSGHSEILDILLNTVTTQKALEWLNAKKDLAYGIFSKTAYINSLIEFTNGHVKVYNNDGAYTTIPWAGIKDVRGFYIDEKVFVIQIISDTYSEKSDEFIYLNFKIRGSVLAAQFVSIIEHLAKLEGVVLAKNDLLYYASEDTHTEILDALLNTGTAEENLKWLNTKKDLVYNISSIIANNEGAIEFTEKHIKAEYDDAYTSIPWSAIKEVRGFKTDENDDFFIKIISDTFKKEANDFIWLGFKIKDEVLAAQISLIIEHLAELNEASLLFQDIIIQRFVKINPKIDMQVINSESIQKKTKKLPQEDKEKAFTTADIMPKIIGGQQALYQHIVYPTAARIAGIEGKVLISFIVETDGMVSNIKIKKDIGGGCGEAAVAALKKVRFKPGMKRGKPVRVRNVLPVIFALE